VEADYRVRAQIRDSLEKTYFSNQNQPFATHIAFQVAFCYMIGFGVKSDDNKCHMWLEKSSKYLDDLKVEKETVRPTAWKNARISCLTNPDTVKLIEEYRAWGSLKLEEARRQYEREISDMTQEFGQHHCIPIVLCKILGDMLDELGDFGKSEVLRMRIRDATEKTCGIDHPSTLIGMADLAWTYSIQGRWKEAEVLVVQVMEKSKRVLGPEHPATLTSMGNLASTYIVPVSSRRLSVQGLTSQFTESHFP